MSVNSPVKSKGFPDTLYKFLWTFLLSMVLLLYIIVYDLILWIILLFVQLVAFCSFLGWWILRERGQTSVLATSVISRSNIMTNMIHGRLYLLLCFQMNKCLSGQGYIEARGRHSTRIRNPKAHILNEAEKTSWKEYWLLKVSRPSSYNTLPSRAPHLRDLEHQCWPSSHHASD